MAEVSSSTAGPVLRASREVQAEATTMMMGSPSAQHRADRPAWKIPMASVIQHVFSTSNRQFWDFIVYPREYFERPWTREDLENAVFFTISHLCCLAAPFYVTKEALLCYLVMYTVSAMGVTMSYHRQLSHRSFTSPKWFEYVLAYCGVLAVQGDPISWVSWHRHHHIGTDTERDVHSPLDGFWWSHMGWLVDQSRLAISQNQSNVLDLSQQRYYRFLSRTYGLHAVVLPVLALYFYGGLPFVLWGFFARVVSVWHATWGVNSLCHVWGFQDWNTGDKSMNNWLIGILTFGEGWHNNHHAFPSSCRHGLKWWQLDATWLVLKAFSFMGLASNLRYPSEARMAKLSDWSSHSS